ncbi:MAG TPA: hypothetical protein VI756_03300 [Blastocatellia bacterium]
MIRPERSLRSLIKSIWNFSLALWLIGGGVAFLASEVAGMADKGDDFGDTVGGFVFVGAGVVWVFYVIIKVSISIWKAKDAALPSPVSAENIEAQGKGLPLQPLPSNRDEPQADHPGKHHSHARKHRGQAS